MQPLDSDRTKEDVGNTVQTYSASQMPPPSPPKTRSRFAEKAAPSSDTLSSPYSSVFLFNQFSVSMVSTTPATCLNITPITCTFIPPQPIFSTTLLILGLDEPPLSFDHTPSGLHAYNLHPHRKSTSDALGLGIAHTSFDHKPTRGRPSKLSKVIKIARDDIAQGYQNTIDWVLRAADTPTKVSRWNGSPSIAGAWPTLQKNWPSRHSWVVNPVI